MGGLRFSATILLALAAFWSGLPAIAWADGVAPARVALLIGNADYPDSDAALATPVSDAHLLADALKARGFTVDVVENGTRKGIDAAVARFIQGIQRDSIALVFFAGHAIQLEGRNYLIPVNARIWNDADVVRDGIAVDQLLAAMSKHGAKADILALDASRRNPFERRFRSVSEGLAATVASPGVLSLTSAAPGTLLNDEPGATSSLFATELAKQIAAPNLDAEQAFAAGRDAIAAQTRNLQNPALVSGLDETFSFDPSRKTGSAATPPAAASPGPSGVKTASAQPESPPAPVAAAPSAPAKPEPAKPEPAKPEPPVVKDATPQPPIAKEVPLPVPAEPPKAVAEAPKAPIPDAPKPAVAAPKPIVEALRPTAPPAAPPAPPPVPKAEPIKAATAPTSPPAAPMGTQVAKAEPGLGKAGPLPPAPDQPAKPIRTPYSEADLKARNALDRRILNDPQDEGAFFERGQLLAEHGDYLLALSDFDRSISLNPNNPEAFNNRCWTRAMENQLETAIDDCNEALKLRANFADAHDSRGLVLLKMGAARAAVLDYDAALKVNPKHSSALYGRGIAELRLGKNSDAENDFSTALALDAGVERDYARYGLK